MQYRANTKNNESNKKKKKDSYTIAQMTGGKCPTTPHTVAAIDEIEAALLNGRCILLTGRPMIIIIIIAFRLSLTDTHINFKHAAMAQQKPYRYYIVTSESMKVIPTIPLLQQFQND